MNELSEYLVPLFGEKLVASDIRLDELTLTVDPEHLVEVVTHLRDDPQCQFKSFVDLCGVDYPARVDRFEVVIHLLSPYLNQRIRVKVLTAKTIRFPRSPASFRALTGSSARPTISTGSCSPGTPIFAASSRITASRGTRCARTSR